MADPALPLHPCQRCGACCAFFHVSFYWREAEEAGEGRHGPVPIELTENRSELLRSMKGTGNKHHTRCVALEGRVGESVACSIYTLRPSPCREFQASFETGAHEPRCDRARDRHGLPPLTRKDWAAHAGVYAHGATPATLREHENETQA